MPKAARSRSAGHAKAVPLRRQAANDSDITTQAPMEPSSNAEISVTASTEVANLGKTSTHEPMKKKDRQLMKQEKFLQRLEASRSPYSKSHERRMKRRAKEQVASGLDEIKAAISAVELGEEIASVDPSSSSMAQPARKARPAPGQIGEGKHTPLSKAQRKQALAAERLRVPMILSIPEFSSNPFETIRKHAQNTLVKHEAPKP